MARCRATFDEYPLNVRKICWKVIRKVQTLNVINNTTPPSNTMQFNALESLGINAKPARVNRGTWCKWDRPSPG